MAAELRMAGNEGADDHDDDNDEDEDLPLAQLMKPKYPFDATTTDCVLDVRSLCALPQDADEDGAAAFRALLLPKGKTLHVPDEPGCYATLGPYRVQSSIALVHFASATARNPELLLAFVDHGMLSNGASTGLFVMSLQLPLQKKRNCFEETPRFTKMADVSGFTSIDAKEQPWCAQLEPALKRQPLFEAHKLYTPKAVVEHLRVPLATRIKGLLDVARAGIADKVTALARQDKRQAEKVKALLTAQLDKSHEWLQSLPPKKYDRRTEERITVVKPGDSEGAAWLTSPQREQLQSGSAQCKPTVRAIRQLQAAADPAADAAPAAAPVHDPLEFSSDSDDSQDPPSGDSEPEPGAQQGEPQLEPTGKGKRARSSTTRFVPDADAQKSAKKPKGERKAKVWCSPPPPLYPHCSPTCTPPVTCRRPPHVRRRPVRQTQRCERWV